MPANAEQRLAHSQLVAGRHDFAFAWLAAPTTRYPHKSFGSAAHAGALHLLIRSADGSLLKRVYTLPLNRVFEDLAPRLVDLDGDGRDEVVLVESDLLRGAALVVLGLRDPAGTPPRDAKRGTRPAAEDMAELARGPYMGTPLRWLKPVGVGDFDGDGHLDVASVSTPHVGGELVLHRYRPPRLEAFARITDVSSHRMGSVEQQFGLVVPPTGAG